VRPCSVVVLLTLLLPSIATRASEPGQGEVLYNGIQLPEPWPPRLLELTPDPTQPRYLVRPPPAILIDVGRQLLVDDFVIEQSSLRRTFHAARYSPENPVLKPDRPWESTAQSPWGLPPDPTAMVFSDGVWYDPQDRLFKMWYMSGLCAATAYATSRDGVHWEKPALDVRAGTNVVEQTLRDSSTVWLDLCETDPQRRFKLFFWRYVDSESAGSLWLKVSPDGVHWGELIAQSGPVGDRTTVFYNPFRKVWVCGLRAYEPGGGQPKARIRSYYEAPDAVALLGWQADDPVLWTRADRLDPRRPELNVEPQLYNLDAVAYESLLLGLFSIWYGQPEDRAKPNEVYVGFSRDGFHWDRPWRKPFIPVSEKYGDWNWANVQSAGGCCLFVEDELYFYVSGRAGVEGSKSSGVCSTGLAVLRRDGFASLDTPNLVDGSSAEATGMITTRPLRFSGRHLFVNVQAPDGELRVEILNERGEVMPAFTRNDCVPLRADSTCVRVWWDKDRDLSQLAGQAIRFRFHLTNGRLYAFWVSPDASGASHGYVAAGGPGFTGPTDTVGRAGRR